MTTEVYKAREIPLVLVLWPPGGGESLVRDEGSWGPVSALGKITGAELRADWIFVEDEAEASKLIKEATNSASVKEADSDGKPKIIRFDRAMTERWEAVYGDILIWFRSGGFFQEEDWTVMDLWELSEGDSITITNRIEDLPGWFQLHPLETSGSLARDMLKRLHEGYQPGEIMDGPNLWRVMAGDRLVWIGASRTGFESIGGILTIADFRCCALVVAEIDTTDVDEFIAFGAPSRPYDPGAISLARHAATVVRQMGPAFVLGESPWTLGD